MKLANDTLTIIGSYLDTEEDTTAYTYTVIPGISWYSTIKTSVGDTGLKSGNLFTIRIPKESGDAVGTYVDPGSYTGAAGTFTLRQGDVIVRGAVSGMSPAQALKANPGSSFRIMGVTDNRRAPNAPHWKVTGA